MYKITEKVALNPTVTKMVIEAPLIAKKAKPGQFIIVRPFEDSERIPLTVAGYDREKGTVDIIFQIVGGTTMELNSLHPLCCCDPFGKVILGDLNTEKLVDIWNGKKARALRESLYKEQYSRKNLKLCSKCDVLVEKLDGIPYTDEDISNQWKNLYSIFNIQ